MEEEGGGGDVGDEWVSVDGSEHEIMGDQCDEILGSRVAHALEDDNVTENFQVH